MPRDTDCIGDALFDGRHFPARSVDGALAEGGGGEPDPISSLQANKLWYLKRINLFRSLPGSALAEVDRMATRDRVARRQLLFRPRDRGDAIYLLEKGRVKLSRFDETGREIILAILEEGEFFGEEALLGDEERHSFAEALEEVTALRIGRADFESLLDDHPDVSREIARQMGERLLGAQKRLVSLAFDDVSSRVAGALVQLSETHGEELPDGGWRLALRITHQELASLVASTRETVTAILGNFRREGLIATQGRELVLTDRDQLQKRAQADSS